MSYLSDEILAFWCEGQDETTSAAITASCAGVSTKQLLDVRNTYSKERIVQWVREGRQIFTVEPPRDTTLAKFFGGRALTGTEKQKDWAEQIRAEKLREMTEVQAIAACDPKGLLKTAKFWINHRKKTGIEIGRFVEEQKRMLAEHQQAVACGDEAAVSKLAEKYNALTAKWGFK